MTREEGRNKGRARKLKEGKARKRRKGKEMKGKNRRQDKERKGKKRRHGEKRKGEERRQGKNAQFFYDAHDKGEGTQPLALLSRRRCLPGRMVGLVKARNVSRKGGRNEGMRAIEEGKKERRKEGKKERRKEGKKERRKEGKKEGRKEGRHNGR
jgi:hypothetical protein